MYVIGFWLNKNLKLHTHCVSAKPAFTAIGAWLCAALLAADFWDPRPLSLPGCWRKRITGLGQGFWEASIAIFGGLVRKQKKKGAATWVTGYAVRRSSAFLPRAREDGTLAARGGRTWERRGIRATHHLLNHTRGPWHCTICDTTPSPLRLCLCSSQRCW